MAASPRSDSARLRNLLAEQQSALHVGVHFHPLPPSHTGATHHGMTGAESPLNSRIIRRPDTASPSGGGNGNRMHTLHATTPRGALPELRAKGMQEESRRAALEGKANYAVTPENRNSDLAHASDRMSTTPQQLPARPHTASAATTPASKRGERTAVPFVIPPRPPMHPQHLPVVQNLPSTTAHAINPPRSADAAMDEVKCANPFFVAHAPPEVDMTTGEPVAPADQQQQQQQQQQVVGQSPAAATAGGDAAKDDLAEYKHTPRSASAASSSRPGSSAYRVTSAALSTSKAAEYHESQREVLNLQLRGVADHSLKMRRELVAGAIDPIKAAATEVVDLCNGCTAALKSYEENYDCVYEIKAPELPKVAEDVKLKTQFGELQRLLALPNVDPNAVKAALAELSVPVEEDPKEDAAKVLSASRLELCRRHLGKLDEVAELSVADSILRMYEVLHTDVLSAPRDLLAADEASLAMMQKDIESLYIRRTNLLDEVQGATNRTAPLMADGPLSATGATAAASSSASSRPGSAATGMSASPVSASREIAALLVAEGNTSSDNEAAVRAEVQRQLIESSPGALRVHTVEALSPPRRTNRDVAAPEDTEDDTDGRKLAIAEATQRREVNTSRELLNRRTNRCNAMLDFVDGIRSFVTDALESQALGKDITAKNSTFLARTIANAIDDLDRVATAVRHEKVEDAAAAEKFAEEQRGAHATLASLTAEEGQLWQQAQALVDKAMSVGRERDGLLMERMRETELESRRQKVHRLKLEKLGQLSTMMTRAKRLMQKYEDAAKACESFHATFVEQALRPKLQQEEELITMRGSEALAFSTAFRNFVFTAEDLMARLEVREQALRQRQRAAAMDESVAQDSLDLAGRDTYLAEMRRLAHMIEETDKRKGEVSAWIRDGRESARVFMPIAVAAREAAKQNKRPGSSAASVRALKLAEGIQDSDFDSALAAREEGLKAVDRAEEALSRQRQTAEAQVEELRSDIRRMKRENDAYVRSAAQQH